MATIADALRRALAQKRVDDATPDLPEDTAPETLRVRYVRCRVCTNVQSYDAFIYMHGGRPHFCECPPGDEDLVTFHVEILKREIEPCI